MIDIGQPFKAWHATCSMCSWHTVIRADQPPPTQCASCLADLATLERIDATINTRDDEQD